MADAEESARKAVELFHAYHVQIFLQSVGQVSSILDRKARSCRLVTLGRRWKPCRALLLSWTGFS